LARWLVRSRYGGGAFKTILPARLMVSQSFCRLAFRIVNPQSTRAQALAKGELTLGEDPRLLGIKVRTVTFGEINELRYSLSDELDFTETGGGMIHMNECWTEPDNLGAWTLGADASLALLFSEPVDTPVSATFLITDVAVNEDYPNLQVSVTFNGLNVANWSLGPGRSHQERQVFVPAHVISEKRPLDIAFHIEQPRTPHELNWTAGDTRALGFRLTKLRIDPVHLPKYKLGDVIDFTNSGNAGPYLNPQWTRPDRYGAWTVGPEAGLTVKFDSPPSPI
jgi:hypothetical protein